MLQDNEVLPKIWMVAAGLLCSGDLRLGKRRQMGEVAIIRTSSRLPPARCKGTLAGLGRERPSTTLPEIADFAAVCFIWRHGSGSMGFRWRLWNQ
jgi:hypothetical protein